MQPAKKSSKRLIWLDLEMTGLDPDNDKILEIATIVTNFNLEVIAVGPELVIKQSDAIVDNMDEWCMNQHGKSGLIMDVKRSTIGEQQAEQMTLDFLKAHLGEKESPMCGNTICQDRRFLYKHMPRLEAFFHYRNLDVSSVKILAQMWASNALPEVKKNLNHRALGDVVESIEELKYYQDNFFKR